MSRNHHYNHLYDQGYSLVEILVVLAIMSVGVGLGTIAFTQVSQQQSLEKAYRLAKTTLYQAREDAYLGRKAQSCDTFLGNQVRLDSVAAEIEVEPVCQTGLSGEIKTIALDEGVAMSATTAQLTFLTVSRITDLSGVMTLTIDVNGQQKQLTITATGEIR